MVKDKYEEDSSEDGVAELSRQFVNALQQYVIPAFDKYNDIRNLDAFVNENPEYYFEVIHLMTGEGFPYKKMIIAKLAGNKNYEAVCNAMWQRLSNIETVQCDVPKEKYLSVYEKIYERLKTVDPLSNPVLD